LIYLSWIDFVKLNGTTETARIADDEKRGYLDLGVIHFGLFALGVSEWASPSQALNGFWQPFGSPGVLIAFGGLAVVSLFLFWGTTVQRHGESDSQRKEKTTSRRVV